MQELSPGWSLDSHQDGEWLCLTLNASWAQLEQTPVNLAELMDRVVRHSFFNRVVLSLESIRYLPARLIRQLILLRDKLVERAGQLLLCDMTDQAYASVCALGLDQVFPKYESFKSVTTNFRPTRPR